MSSGEVRWESYGHHLARKVQKIRQMRGLSQTRLAELAEVSRTTIVNIERNENNRGQAVDPKLSVIYRIALALDVPPAALIPGGAMRVTEVCAEDSRSLEVDFVWPSAPNDSKRFDSRHLVLGHPGEQPTYEKD